MSLIYDIWSTLAFLPFTHIQFDSVASINFIGWNPQHSENQNKSYRSGARCDNKLKSYYFLIYYRLTEICLSSTVNMSVFVCESALQPMMVSSQRARERLARKK